MQNNKILTNIFYVLAILLMSIALLYIGKTIIIPIIIAFFISIGIVTLSNTVFFSKIKYYYIRILLSVIFIGVIFFYCGKLISSNINYLIQNSESFQNILELKLSTSMRYIGVDNMARINNYIQKIDINHILNIIVNTSTLVLSKFGLIMLYTSFFLLEYKFFKKKINIILDDEGNELKKNRVVFIIKKIINDIKDYFFIKFISSLLTGLLIYLVLMLFNIQLSFFWGFLAFILNFIPTLGSIAIIGMLLLYLIVVSPSFIIFIFTLMLCILIEILIGNIIEPNLLGKKLNLSPLIILISLLFWGTIWGFLGMALAVPIMVFLNIVFSNIKATQPIAVLLSEKGNINILEDK